MGRIFCLRQVAKLRIALFLFVSILLSLIIVSTSHSRVFASDATDEKAYAWGLYDCLKTQGTATIGREYTVNSNTLFHGDGEKTYLPHYGHNQIRKYSCPIVASHFGLISTNLDSLKKVGYKFSGNGRSRPFSIKSKDDTFKKITGKPLSHYNATNIERFTMYSEGLKAHRLNIGECGASPGKNKVASIKDGSLVYCKYTKKKASIGASRRPNGNSDSTTEGEFWVFHPDKNQMAHVKGLDKLIEYLNKVAKRLKPDEIKQIGNTLPGITPSSNDDSDDDNPSEMDDCYKNSGAFGWVFCPAIVGLHSVAETLYGHIESWLGVRPSVVAQLSQSKASALFNLWSKFRDFANAVFVAMFLLIILSQVTGFGLSNYNVKKMLPKLVVTAILINFSFIICALAVDASNLLGSSLKQMLTSVGETVGGGGVCALGQDCSSGVLFKKILSTVVGLVGIGAGAKIVSISSFTGWSLMSPVILFLVSVALAVFFAFVILGVRQALILLLIATSPLAFACYMLPNTEKIFSVWKNAFSKILLVYPICGALIGGGFLTSRILLIKTNDSGSGELFIFTIVSGLLTVVPYFLIPSLVTKTFDAIGNMFGMGALGGRMTGFSNRARHAAANRIESSRPFQSRTMQSNKIRENKINKRIADKLKAKQQRDGKLSALDSLRLSAAVNAINTADEADIKGFRDNIASGSMRIYDDKGKNLIEDASDYGQIAGAMRHLANKGDNRTDDETKQMLALFDILSSTKNGRNEASNFLNEAYSNGDELDATTRRELSQNLLTKHSDAYSDTIAAREWAKIGQSELSNGQLRASGKSASYKDAIGKASSLDKLSAEHINKMDRRELDRIIEARRSGEMSAKNAKAVDSWIARAKADENFVANANAEKFMAGKKSSESL